jgi:hypothetical protein
VSPSFGDELSIGRLGADGHLLLSLALFCRGVDTPTAALAAGGRRSGSEFHPAELLGGEGGRPKAYSSFFVSMCQKRTTSFRATATVATFTPRRARIRSANAWSGPGARATTQADSTRAQRAPAHPGLEIEPWRAGVIPDWWTLESRPR